MKLRSIFEENLMAREKAQAYVHIYGGHVPRTAGAYVTPASACIAARSSGSSTNSKGTLGGTAPKVPKSISSKAFGTLGAGTFLASGFTKIQREGRSASNKK